MKRKESKKRVMNYMTKKLEVKRNVLLAPFTTWKVGGPTKYFVIANTISELKSAIEFALEKDLQVFILGKGSNVLVSDKGFYGLVVVLGRDFQRFSFENTLVRSGAAFRLAHLAREAAKRSLSGLEWAVGIPGTIGGAVMTNAGAHGSEISEILNRATFLTFAGELASYQKKEIGFSYRECAMKGKGIVLEVEFKLTLGTVGEIQKKMSDFFEERKRTQPIAEYSAGSVFKNPEGNFAAKLIEDCGLKGEKKGGAMVSMKHANFIVNLNKASASDIFSLIAKIKEEVYKKTGVLLEPEIEFVGDFN